MSKKFNNPAINKHETDNVLKPINLTIHGGRKHGKSDFLLKSAIKIAYMECDKYNFVKVQLSYDILMNVYS